MAIGLKPEVSLGTSVALLALDLAIFNGSLPGVADIRATSPHSAEIDGARKTATWTAIGVAGALSIMTKDPNLFIFGGGLAVALDWYYRHANARSPQTGGITLPPDDGMQPGGVPAAAAS